MPQKSVCNQVPPLIQAHALCQTLVVRNSACELKLAATLSGAVHRDYSTMGLAQISSI